MAGDLKLLRIRDMSTLLLIGQTVAGETIFKLGLAKGPVVVDFMHFSESPWIGFMLDVMMQGIRKRPKHLGLTTVSWMVETEMARIVNKPRE